MQLTKDRSDMIPRGKILDKLRSRMKNGSKRVEGRGRETIKNGVTVVNSGNDKGLD